jgi:hypothetical protein
MCHVWIHCKLEHELRIAQERAVLVTTDTQFYRRQKELDRFLTDEHRSASLFYENTKRYNFLWVQDFDSSCVCNPTFE